MKSDHVFPEVGWRERLALNVMPPMQVSWSGELVADVCGVPAGTARFKGRVKRVWVSCAQSGKDDSNELNFSGDVMINDTSCLTTMAGIAHISGEDSQQKTTGKTGDTGIVEAVLDYSNNSFEIGDVLEVDLHVTRTASPTQEIQCPVVVVELEPVK